MGLLRRLDHIFHQITRNKDHTAAITEHHIPGQAYRTANLHRRIKTIHHKIFDRRGIYAPVIDLQPVNSLYLLQIPDAAPDYRAARYGPISDRCGEISAYKSPLIYLIVHISDHNVALH